MRTDGQTDMMKLIIDFRNFANVPNNCILPPHFFFISVLSPLVINTCATLSAVLYDEREPCSLRLCNGVFIYNLNPSLPRGTSVCSILISDMF